MGARETILELVERITHDLLILRQTVMKKDSLETIMEEEE